MFTEAKLAPSAERSAAVTRAWNQLTGPGALLTSTQRIAVIGAARDAWSGAEAPDSSTGVIGEAAYWLAVDAEGISADLVADFEERGLDRLRYTEVVGVVARLSNIDWYLRALGADLPELPVPDLATPSNNVHPDARMTDSWVPMLTNASAPHTLDALPDEGNALRDLHEPMYINMSSILDWHHADELSRAQVEFLAARASYLNECFY